MTIRSKTLVLTFLFLLLLLFDPAKVQAATTLPQGFQESVVFSGLIKPTSIRFASDGRIFIGEKSGVIKVFDDLSDTLPSVLISLKTQVHDYWDRGLLGLAIDPSFSTRPYVYVLYTYDAPIGGTAPVWKDTCPTPPGGTTDGCVVSGRLSRFEVGPNNEIVGTEKVLIQNQWCQQYPSHSMGDLAFGPEGALYVSAGDGASFGFTDYGQGGGSTGSPTPRNPCGDPPSGVGGIQSPPSAEGGALRSQDLQAAADPVTYDGSVLRVNPDTGLAWPTNFLIGGDSGDDSIIAYGLRNPYRFTLRPGTNEVWIGDVGSADWEEINRITNPNGITNFGWPCYEGVSVQAGFGDANLNICENLYAQGPSAVAAPYYAYNHASKVNPAGDACKTGSSSTTGLAFYTQGVFPIQYNGALFFADYSRDCIYVMRAGSNGNPDLNTRTAFGVNADNPVDLQIGPGGDLYYVDHTGGTIRRIEFLTTKNPPVAKGVADPTSGKAPLKVQFDGSQSSDPDPGTTLIYRWDLDGDGQYDDSKKINPSNTYAKRSGDYTVTVGLKVMDDDGLIDTDQILISVGNSAPTAAILTPSASLKWKVGDVISFSGKGTDPDDGEIPPSSMSWEIIMHHCPAGCHTHSLQNISGVDHGTFTAQDHEWYSYLEFKLTVTDSGGLTDETSIFLDPLAVNLTFKSVPSGLNLTVDGVNTTTPFTRTFIVGSMNSISAPTPQNLGSIPYSWISWSDGGAQSHQIKAGQNPITYTARYCSIITLAPSTLPPASIGQPYNQSISATGGTAPYTYTVTAGTLPPGLSLSTSGLLSGTPNNTGNFDFTVTSKDVNGCKGTKSYTLALNALLFDDFNGQSGNWEVVKGSWTESNGELIGVSDGKAIVFAPNPWIPSGLNACSKCRIQVEDVRTSGGDGNIISIIGWFTEDDTNVELIFKEEKDIVLLKQKVGGKIVAKGKAPLVINPNTSFDLVLSFDGSKFEVVVDGTLILTLITDTAPNGTVGFSLKRTTGSFGKILVN